MSSNRADEFNARLLLVRRQYMGLSQTDLARQCKITQGHYSKIENGILTPALELISEFGRFLDCPDSFFFQPDKLVGLPVSVHPMFRKRSSVGQREIERLQAELNLRLMDIRRLLRAVELQPQYRLPKLDFDEYDGDINEIARLVRAQWLLPSGPVDNLTDSVERAGCVIVNCELPGKIDGVTLNVPGLHPCIFLNDAMPADRMRFSLAHELGHLVMHETPNPEMEDQANAFASAFLMPSSDIRGQFGSVTLERLASLKRLWRVSMAALLVRANTLEQLGPGQKQYLWRQMSSNGYRRHEPASTEFPKEQPQLLSEVVDLHMKSLGYNLSDLSAALHVSSHELQQRLKIAEQRLRLVPNLRS